MKLTVKVTGKQGTTRYEHSSIYNSISFSQAASITQTYSRRYCREHGLGLETAPWLAVEIEPA